MTNAIIEAKILQCTCSQCAKTAEYKERGLERDFMGNSPIHSFPIGLMPPASKLDGQYVSFDLCDQCLFNLINGFTPEAKNEILYDPFEDYANAMIGYVLPDNLTS